MDVGWAFTVAGVGVQQAAVAVGWGAWGHASSVVVEDAVVGDLYVGQIHGFCGGPQFGACIACGGHCSDCGGRCSDCGGGLA